MASAHIVESTRGSSIWWSEQDSAFSNCVLTVHSTHQKTILNLMYVISRRRRQNFLGPKVHVQENTNKKTLTEGNLKSFTGTIKQENSKSLDFCQIYRWVNWKKQRIVCLSSDTIYAEMTFSFPCPHLSSDGAEQVATAREDQKRPQLGQTLSHINIIFFPKIFELV